MNEKTKMTYKNYKRLISEKNDEIKTLKEEIKQLEETNDELNEQLEDVKRQL